MNSTKIHLISSHKLEVSTINSSATVPDKLTLHFLSVSKQISIYNLDANNDEPILTMKLCNYFDDNTIEFMSVTSDSFKTVELYYDCCLPYEPENCHVYEKNNRNDDLTDHIENPSDSTTIRFEGEYTTLNSNETDTNLPNEPTETTMEITETTMEITETTVDMEVMETTETDVDDSKANEVDAVEIDFEKLELTHLSGVEKTKTFLNTSNFQETSSTMYIYQNGTSTIDYCPNEIADAELTQNTETNDIHVDEEEPVISIFSSSVLRSLVG